MSELTKPSKLAVVILAAGKGTRMNNPEIAKVMYEINGRPMVDYVVDVAAKLQPTRIIAVVGWQKQSVIDYLSAKYPSMEFIDQCEQLGTGHAVIQTSEPLKDFDGDLLVLSGDVPLLTEQTVKALIGYHRTNDSVATILTAELDNPVGYGRIVRNQENNVEKIVEHKDATKKQLAIREINSGIYVFVKQKLMECLPHLSVNNAQGEYYLTDVFELFWKHRWKVSAVKAIDAIEVIGINDIQQLEEARTIMATRTAH
ncbi:MAG: NTP transferase domain-containing protein [Ignavibacteriae bacterium]|nr:NTP transferase domain-containing protein [Ignavibacteriota bacterium]